MQAGIPYTPFPEIPLGPIQLQTFGLCVAVGILLGAVLAIRRNRRLGISVDETERIIIGLVVAGLVGARLLWVIVALAEDQQRAPGEARQIASPVDVIAVWEGGLQFAGGFIAALLLAPILTRRLTSTQRWHLIDSSAIGLALGLAIGRIGCYAVGEHLGGPTSFPLGITYQGGATVEGPLRVGETYWSTPVLEFIYVLAILGVMLWVDRRGTAGAGTLAGIFSLGYAVTRFASDFLRDYDTTVLGLTGAQYMTIALLPLGAWFVRTARSRQTPEEAVAALEGAHETIATDEAPATAAASTATSPSAADVDTDGRATDEDATDPDEAASAEPAGSDPAESTRDDRDRAEP